MSVPSRPARPDTAPALFRLLADSALSRAALGCCGVPVVILDAAGKSRPVTFANAAFESFFGYGGHEIAGKPIAALLFRGDEALVQKLVDSPRRWELTAWNKDGTERAVEVTLAAVRAVDGKLTHWVMAFSDRGEVERLRAEVQSLKTLAASSLGVRLEPSAQPAEGLYSDRQSLRVLERP